MQTVPVGEEPEERAAADLMGSVLSAENDATVWLRYIESQHNRQVDYDVEFDGATRDKVEVTTLVWRELMTSWATWRKDKPDGWCYVAGLAGTWLLMVDALAGSKPRQVLRQVAAFLPDLEARGVRYWEPQMVTLESTISERTFAQSGVVHAERVDAPAKDSSNVNIGLVNGLHPRPYDDPNHVVTVLNEEMRPNSQMQGHVDKLLATDAAARHLFVWIDTSRLDVLRAFDCGCPTMPPAIDPRITLWFAPLQDEPPVIRWSSGPGWEEVYRPEVEA